jgi:hypothetical protein
MYMTDTNLKAALSAAASNYLGELKQAGDVWEQKPTTAGEGEDAWSARQVAEHVAGASLYFANGLAKAVGAEGPAMQRFQFATAPEAVEPTERGSQALLTVLDAISDEQLATEFDTGSMGKQTPRWLADVAITHFRDHAKQLGDLRA